MTPILHIAGLSYSYRTKNGTVAALKNVNVDIDPRGLTAVIGPNGSGKSTLFSLVTGLQRVQTGELRFARASMRIAAVFQSPSLDRELTVFENFWHYAMLFGRRLRRSDLPAAVLDAFQLGQYMDRPVKELSGGYQRRAEIAKVLCIAPDMLVMDEPFTGLDAVSRESIFTELRQYTDRTGLPVLMVTHELELASRCDSVLLLEHGAVSACGTPAELLSALGESVVEITAPDVEAVAAGLRPVLGPERVAVDDTRVLVLRARLEDVLPLLDENTRSIAGVTGRRPSLDDLARLRDDAPAQKPGQLGVAA